MVQSSSTFDSSFRLLIPRPTTMFTPGGSLKLPQCPLCEKRGSLKNILSCCTRVLGDGRYIRCHNQVLRVIANVFNKCFRISTYEPISRRFNFLKAGSGCSISNVRKKTLLLSTAPEGKLFVDLDEQLKFPDHIVRTQLQPDMILVLNQMKESDHVGVDGIVGGKHGKSHERKLTKYQ